MCRRILLLCALILSACTGGHEQHNSWKSSYSAEECLALTAIDSIQERCGNGDWERAIASIENDITSCLPYSSPMRLEGVWTVGFEHSAFHEGADSYADVQVDLDRLTSTREDGDPSTHWTWLSTTEAAADDVPPIKESEVVDGRWTFDAFAVDLVGRKSLCEAFDGHLGVSEHEVIVSDFLSIVRLAKDGE